MKMKFFARHFLVVIAMVVCAEANSSSQYYDNTNRLLCVIYDPGTYTTYTYDPAGNLTNTTNAAAPSNGVYPVACGGTAGSPNFSTTSVVTTGVNGNAITLVVSATGNPTPTLSLGAGSTLPPGVTFNPATGTFSGTPTTPGTYTGTIVATNNVGTSSVSYSITITAPQAVVEVPTLGSYALLAMSMLLAGFGLRRARRHSESRIGMT